MSKLAKSGDLNELVLLILLGILWGIPFALTRISLATIPPITMVAARVSLAAIALWIVVFASRLKFPKRRNLLPHLLVQGCFACVLPYTLLAFGQHSVDSALTAILNSTTPLFVCLARMMRLRDDRPTSGQLLGVSLGLAGAVMIAGISALTGLGESVVGEGAIILASAASAGSVIYGRQFTDTPPEITAAGTLTSAALVLVPMCFILEAPLRSVPSAASAFALLANGVVVTAFGFVVYFRLIRTIGSMRTASASYQKPVVGVLIGCTLMNEPLTWTIALGLLAIILGVVAINQRPVVVPRHT
jgi:drug/metabolite transporter (DMT)-like permease